MDYLLDSAGGSVTYRDIRSAVAKEIHLEMRDPEVDAFRNLHRMNDPYEIMRFNPISPSLGNSLVDPGDSDYSSIDSATVSRMPCRPKGYFYKIGEYKTSTFYRKFLSDELICLPSGRMVTVRDTTEHTSLNPKSSFWAWFRMPLSKVSEIVDCFITKGWIVLMHHCRTNERLQVKAELLVLGTLTMLAGMLQSFRQLKTLTHTCASEHSNFFLKFVNRVSSISREYIFMPRMHEELGPIMRRYEEAGFPGVAESVDVVHVK
jgi:hypothetical protein